MTKQLKAKRAKLTSGEFKATGKAVQIGTARGNLGEMQTWGPTRSATIVVGLKRGENRQNKTGKCEIAPKEFTPQAADIAFETSRLLQVKENKLAATRRTGKGWFQGKPEPSVAYEVFHDPSVPGEKSYDKFKKQMERIAEAMGGGLCQDSVLVVHDNGDKRKTRAAVRK